MLGALLAALVWLGLQAPAQNPVGTVSSDGNLVLNGISVSRPGVASWPLAAGDQVRTAEKGAVISLQDGTRIVLAPNTRVTVGGSGKLSLDLQEGGFRYQRAQSSAIEFYARGRSIGAAPASGAVTLKPEGAAAVSAVPGDSVGLEMGKPKKPQPRSKHRRRDDDN